MPLRPGLLDQLRAANNPPSEDTVRSLGDIAADVVADYNNTPEGQARQQAAGSLEHAIPNPDGRAAFETTFDNSGRLLSRIGITPPAVEQLTEAGFDLHKLSDAYEDLERDG